MRSPTDPLRACVVEALAVLLIWLCAVTQVPVATHAQPAAPLTQIATIALPDVAGRIDHLGFDPVRQRLFIAALGNNTVEVIDAATNTRVRSVTGLHEPQGVAVLPELSAIAVANGATGTLQLIDAVTFQTRWTVQIGGDADNVRYHTGDKRLYVAAEGGLYVVDPVSGHKVGRIRIDGHPESFQLGASEPRVFANLPGLVTSEIVVSDRQRRSVIGHWPTAGCGANYPIALDERASRLFVGCRRPARVAMFDSHSGTLVTSLDAVGDADDLFLDEARSRVYVIGGEGFVDVVGRAGDTLMRQTRVSTRAGARTGLWVPAAGRLYVAVPARGAARAEVRVFQAR